jgi:hypothetical protein
MLSVGVWGSRVIILCRRHLPPFRKTLCSRVSTAAPVSAFSLVNWVPLVPYDGRVELIQLLIILCDYGQRVSGGPFDALYNNAGNGREGSHKQTKILIPSAIPNKIRPLDDKPGNDTDHSVALCGTLGIVQNIPVDKGPEQLAGERWRVHARDGFDVDESGGRTPQEL